MTARLRVPGKCWAPASNAQPTNARDRPHGKQVLAPAILSGKRSRGGVQAPVTLTLLVRRS